MPKQSVSLDTCYGAIQMVFQHRFLCHRQQKMAKNRPCTQGSLLPLLNFVIVLRAQLPVREGTAALPKLQLKPWVMR
jgi:hypothetical protein